MCSHLSKLKLNTLFSVRVPRRLLSAPMSRRGYSQTISLIGVIASSVLPDDVGYGRRREGDTDTGPPGRSHTPFTILINVDADWFAFGYQPLSRIVGKSRATSSIYPHFSFKLNNVLHPNFKSQLKQTS